MKNKRVAKKILTGLLFLASLFIAAVALVASAQVSNAIVFVAIAGVLMLIAGYFFLSAIFEEKTEEWENLFDSMEQEAQEEEGYEQLRGTMESVDRTQKAVFSVMKRREESSEEKIIRLEHAIDRLAEQQEEQHKELIRYNKENARQMAISERETLEHMLKEVLKKMEELQAAGISVAASAAEEELPEEEPAYEETPDFLSEFGLAPELDSLLEEETDTIGFTDEEDTDLLDFTEEEPDLVGFMEEEPEETEPVTETAAPVVSTEALGTSTGVDLSDPNAALSPEDIARLFAAAGN